MPDTAPPAGQDRVTDSAATDPFAEAIVTALRERFPDITDVQIGEFLAMADDHARRLIEARNGT